MPAEVKDLEVLFNFFEKGGWLREEDRTGPEGANPKRLYSCGVWRAVVGLTWVTFYRKVEGGIEDMASIRSDQPGTVNKRIKTLKKEK